MLESLKDIDISVIDDLTEIRAQRITLQDRLARLEADKKDVSAPVYSRVFEDYTLQDSDLASKAEPLANQARIQYQKLAKLVTEAEEEVGANELEIEELELRHRVGEFDKEKLKKRSLDADSQLKARRADLNELLEVKSKFLEAFESEIELSQIPDVVPTPESASSGVEVESDSVKVEDVKSADLSDAQTEKPDHIVEPPIEPEEVKDEPAPQARSASTELLPIAFLIPLDNGPEGDRLPLEPLTTIGRTQDNQLPVKEDSVSRHHAEIMLEEDGFVIRDLESGNGTYVNGESIKEQILVDGDRVQVGTVRFRFQLGDSGDA